MAEKESPMDDDKKDNNLEELSPEEQSAEQEALQEVKDDELRDKLADELGLDPEDHSEILDKAVERELAQRERLSGAIKQKISWRDKATQSLQEKPTENPSEGKTQTQETPDIEELVDRKLAERLEQRELESLNLSEELQTEVKDLAKLKGISVREASQHPYIQSRKEEVEREERVKSATPKRTNKGSYVSNIDPSKPLNPADFDFNSEEGIKAWNEAKAMKARHQAQQ